MVHCQRFEHSVLNISLSRSARTGLTAPMRVFPVILTRMNPVKLSKAAQGQTSAEIHQASVRMLAVITLFCALTGLVLSDQPCRADSFTPR